MDATGKEQAFSTRPMRGASVLSAASETSVVALIRDQGAETLWLSGGGVDRLIDAVNADFAARAFARPIPVEHRDRFGREARSWLTLPVGLPVREVKGVVVNLYPGSVSNDAHIDPRVLLYGIRAPLLAAAGYAVLSPAMPESPDDAAGGAGYVASVDLAVDAALKAEPDLPKDRIAILGHSFGGTAALAIAARTNRYRSYVAWSAVTAPSCGARGITVMAAMPTKCSATMPTTIRATPVHGEPLRPDASTRWKARAPKTTAPMTDAAM